MAKSITKFIADDGTEFDLEEDAIAHDKAITEAAKFEGYIAAAGLERAQAGLLRVHLPQFLAYINDGTVPPKVEKKPKKEKAPAETPAPNAE